MGIAPASEWRWQDRGLCRGEQATLFYPPAHFERPTDKVERETAAKAICVCCPVRPDCLDFAITNDEHAGVWGGTTEAERRAFATGR